MSLTSSSSAVDDTPSERLPPSRQSSSATHDFPARRASSSFAASPDEHSGVTPRDEAAYYQAETVNLTRENMMLRVRVRELGLWIRFLAVSPFLLIFLDFPLFRDFSIFLDFCTFRGGYMLTVQNAN